MIKLTKILTDESFEALNSQKGVNIEVSDSRTSRLKHKGCMSCVILLNTGDNPYETSEALKFESIDNKYTHEAKWLLSELSIMLKKKKYIKARQLDEAIKLFGGVVPGLPIEYIDMFNRYVKK